MARPPKEGIDYFPHDTDAVNDEKIEALRSLYGNDGYAFYFILLERIYRTSEGELDISSEIKKATIISKLNISGENFEKMLKHSFEVELFDKSIFSNTGKITSVGIKKRFEEVQKLRDKWRSKKKFSPEKTPQKTPERKGKERKENNILIEEEESKKKVAEVFTFFQQNINALPTPFQNESISKYIDDGLDPDMILEIFKDSLGKTDKWKWIEKVLNNTFEQKVFTLERYNAEKALRKQQREEAKKQNNYKNTSPSNMTNFNSRTYSKEETDSLYEEV